MEVKRKTKMAKVTRQRVPNIFKPAGNCTKNLIRTNVTYTTDKCSITLVLTFDLEHLPCSQDLYCIVLMYTLVAFHV